MYICIYVYMYICIYVYYIYMLFTSNYYLDRISKNLRLAIGSHESRARIAWWAKLDWVDEHVDR
jgi:hypothetical protein